MAVCVMEKGRNRTGYCHTSVKGGRGRNVALNAQESGNKMGDRPNRWARLGKIYIVGRKDKKRV